MSEAIRQATARVVATAIETGAALYVREKQLPHLIRDWDQLSDSEIVEKLQRAIRAASRALASGHWTADSNRVLALRQALAGELRLQQGGRR